MSMEAGITEKLTSIRYTSKCHISGIAMSSKFWSPPAWSIYPMLIFSIVTACYIVYRLSHAANKDCIYGIMQYGKNLTGFTTTRESSKIRS